PCAATSAGNDAAACRRASPIDPPIDRAGDGSSAWSASRPRMAAESAIKSQNSFVYWAERKKALIANPSIPVCNPSAASPAQGGSAPALGAEASRQRALAAEKDQQEAAQRRHTHLGCQFEVGVVRNMVEIFVMGSIFFHLGLELAQPNPCHRMRRNHVHSGLT